MTATVVSCGLRHMKMTAERCSGRGRHRGAGGWGLATSLAVVVTAEDGETTRAYTVTVTRGGSARCDAECAFAERGDAGA